MIILKQMKCENTTLPSPRAALKDHPKGSQNGSQIDVQKSSRNGLSGETSNAQNALFSLCFRTKRSVAGTPKGLPKGTPKGVQKGARNEARKGAEAGIELKMIIVLKIWNADLSGFSTYPGHIFSSPPDRPIIELKIIVIMKIIMRICNSLFSNN